MKKGAKAVLTVSLVLNILLAGIMIGEWSHRFIAGDTFDIAAKLAQLPTDKQALFDAILGPALRQMDAAHLKMDEEKKKALTLLKAETFDKEAYLTEVDHIEDMHAQMKMHIASSVAELSSRLTPGERATLAEIVSHPPFALPPGALQRKSDIKGP